MKAVIEYINGMVQVEDCYNAGSFQIARGLISKVPCSDGEKRCYSIVVTKANRCCNIIDSLKEHFQPDRIRQTSPSTYYMEIIDTPNW